MARKTPTTAQMPIRELLTDAKGLLTFEWQKFFRLITASIDHLGTEQIVPIANSQLVAVDVDGLKFESSNMSQAVVDFLIQRITTGSGAQEIVTSGTFHAVYKPTSDTWAIVMMGTPGPSSSGITFSILANGQVRYTSSNITGTASISRLVYRARSLAGKHVQYSSLGVGPLL